MLATIRHMKNESSIFSHFHYEPILIISMQ